MKLKFRLAYYLFGLLIGIFFTIYFMNSKAAASGVEFCYFPNCRALKDLRSKPLYIDSLAQKTLNEKWVTLEDIKMSLKHGDIDFSKSNKPLEKGKLYTIEGKTKNNQDIIIEMINFTEKVRLKSIQKNSK